VLKTRILTALVIFPATLAIVFLLTPAQFRVAIAVLFMISCWEFRRLADLPAAAGTALLTLQALLMVLGLFYWNFLQAYALPLLIAGCVAWLLMFSRLFGYSPSVVPDKRYRLAGFLSAIASGSICWFSLSWLHAQTDGKLVIFLLLLIIWASDTGAYFSGKQFGRRKLAPVISPNKTWEGVYGGLVLALIAAFAWSGPLAHLDIALLPLVLTTVITAFASIGGDLFISVHKRTVKVADAGSIFPGHGGVLDRYDSLMAGAPFFALALGLLAL
jgi:phosphatidate cytidylyltransferase